MFCIYMHASICTYARAHTLTHNHTRCSGVNKKSSLPEKHTSASNGSSSDASKRSGSVARERRRSMQEKHESGTSAIDCLEKGLRSKCQPSS